MNKHISRLELDTVYGLLILLLFWQLLHSAIQSTIIPDPYVAIKRFISLLPGTLLPHMLASLVRIIGAVVISIVAGAALGLFTGVNDKADKLISPIIYVLYPVPKIAFLPIFMLLFGLGNTSKILIVTAIIIFQIIVTTRDGVREIPMGLFYSARSLGMNKLELYRHLIIPAVMPKIITSLRISIGTSIAVLFFSENYATRYGIGYFIMNCWAFINYVDMFAGILALSMLGYVLFKVVDYVEVKLCRWVMIAKNDRRNA
ncbi:MAG: ABC transporter permease [Clostridiales bacterium GWB2_37_7]|nr:MAG: ABC transporter permease [Clostridiales bacterium GWB2_37_7]